MCPIDVVYPGFRWTSSADKSRVMVGNTGIKVVWHGDKVGQAEVYLNDEYRAGFPLTAIGTMASVEFEVTVSPIEAGEVPTQVRRELTLKRT